MQRLERFVEGLGIGFNQPVPQNQNAFRVLCDTEVVRHEYDSYSVILVQPLKQLNHFPAGL